jgi:hypothetical protein
MPPEPGNGGVLAAAVPLGKLAETVPLPEMIIKSLHSEADALPLAEAERAQVAEAAGANISAPIMDSATNRSNFFTIPPSVASHPIAMLGTRLCLGQGAPAPLFT